LHKKKKCKSIWPIHPKSWPPPDEWNGWPEKKKFALVLTHDVDTQRGHDLCYDLIELEEQLGYRSSYNFVPERYRVEPSLRKDIQKRGFEVGVHGLNHDGNLYRSRNEFSRRAAKINKYLKEWDAVGFRSPAMHHNLDWIHELDIQYDASTFDTDPFEPQSDGVGTIFPFWVNGTDPQNGYVELPYTLAQDHLLFIIMRETNSDVWKQKLDWIAKHGGMALLNVHPDYMNFGDKKCSIEEYPAQIYIDFLHFAKEKHKGNFWHALPKEVAGFWHKRFL